MGQHNRLWRSIDRHLPSFRKHSGKDRKGRTRQPLFEALEERHMLSCGGAFSIDSAEAYEPHGSVVLTVTLSGASCSAGQTASVSYTTSDGTATVAGNDYTPTGGTLSFTSNGSQTISVPINNDGLTEGDEEFSVALSSPTNATITSGSSSGTATIRDGQPTLWVSDIRVAEESTSAVLTIQISHATSMAITGNWATADGTAVSSGSPGDYDATSGSFTIPASSTSVQIQVDINEDEIDEWDESFTVTLSNVANATVGNGTATVTIVDDEQSPQLFSGRIADADSGIEEGCPVCAGDDLFLSWAEAYDGNYIIYSNYFWGSTIGGPGPGPGDGCEEAQDSGQAARLFREDSLPQYQVASSGLTYIETRVTIPEFDVADKYSVAVTLTSATGAGTFIPTVYFDGAGLEAGDEIVLAVQVDAEALQLANGYYKTTSLVTAHDASYQRSETTVGWTVLANRHGSPYGDLWWIPDLDRLHIYTSGIVTGAALVRGDGTTAWFSESGGTFTNRAEGSFSTLVKEVGGQTEYVLTTRYNEKFRFASDGYLIKRYDAQGNETEFNYDNQNRLTSIVDPFGRTTEYAYDSGANRIDYIENFAGQRIDFTVDSGSNDLVAVALDDPDVAESEPAPSYALEYFDAPGERYHGFLESISFDMVRVPGASAATSSLQLTYNELGQVDSALNADDSQWELSSVQSKALAHLVTGDGTAINDPAAAVLVSELTAEKENERGYTTTYTTDRFGNLTSIKDALDNVTTIERNSYGQITVITEPDPDGVEPNTGAITQFSYLSPENGGHLDVVTNPDGSTRTFANYHATFGIARHLTDELGRETLLTLNADGLVEQIDQNGDADDIITEFAYTDGTTLPKGLLLTVEDAEGIITEYDYIPSGDDKGWLQSITYNSGGTVEITNLFGYDDKGNLASFTDGEGRVTFYTYDALNQLRKAVGPYPNSAAGGLATVDNGDLDYAEPGSGWDDGAVTGYQDDQRVAEETAEPGAVATWTFNGLVRGATYEVAVTWEHDGENGADNSPFSVYDGSLAGNLLATVPVDQSVAPTEHPLYESPSEWEIIGHYTLEETTTLTVALRSQGAEDGKNVLADAVRINLAPPSAEYECNEQGGKLKETDGKGRVTEYGFDAVGRLEHVKLPDPAGGAAEVYLRYGYDPAGNLTKAVAPDPDGGGPRYAPAAEYEYDALNRVVSIAAPYPDPTGGEIIDDSAGTTSKFETSAGWTTATPDGHGGGHRWADDSGGEWADWKFTGLVPGKTYEVLVTWVADENNATNVQPIVYDGPPGTLPPFTNPIPALLDQTQSPGDIAALNDPNDSEDDNGNGWTSIGAFTISGEALSVRLSNQAVDGNVIADAVRIVEARAVTTYDYDHAYNLVRVVDAKRSETKFAYDERHRIVKITEADPDGIYSAERPVTRFVYDAASQIRQTIDPLGRATRYIYDEDLPRLKEIRYPHPVVTLHTPQLLDDSDADFFETWVEDVDGGYFDYHAKVTNNDNAGAIWTFEDVAPGEYEVFVTWTLDATADDATYYVSIDDGGWQPHSVDQRNAPADGNLFRDGSKWQRLGDYTVGPTEDTVAVALVGQSGVGKTVVADAVRLMPKAPTYAYEYGETGAVTKAIDPLGGETVYAYDPFYRLETLTLPDPDPNAENDRPSWHYAYDKAHNTTLVTDPLGRETAYQYDGLNRLIQTVLPDPDGPGGGNPLVSPEYFYDYELDGGLLRLTDPLARVTSYEYDLWGRATKATFPKPLGTETYAPYVEYAYDYLSRLTSLTENVNGGTTDTRTFAYDYDALGRLVEETLPDPGDGTISGNSPVYRTAYNVLGQVVQETDARGNPTRFTYDGLHRLTQITFADPDGPGTGNGNLAPSVTKYWYDDASQVAQVATTLEATYSDGSPVYDYAYTGYEYDPLGRTTKVTLPDEDTGGLTGNSPTHEYTYDDAGNVLSHTDPLGKVTDYAYDGLYRLVNRQDPDPDSPESGVDRPSIDYAYDRAGNLTSLTDTLGNETAFVYDGLDRLIREEVDLDDPTGGDDRFYTYDVASRLEKKIDRNERKTTYHYDAWDRLVEEKWFADDADATADDVLRYAYDYVGNVTDADADYGADAAWESTLHYAYDRLGRVSAIGVDYDNSGGVADLGVDFAIGYDIDGYRETFAATIASGPDAGADFVNAYTFDPLGRLTALTQAAQDAGTGYNVVADKRVEFSYRADGQFKEITRFASLASDPDDDVVKSSYGYDKLGRLTSLAHTDVAEVSSPVPRAEYTWEYDKFNRLLEATEQFNDDLATDRAIAHTYDHNGQLASTIVDLPSPTPNIETYYTYDANGNRTSGQTPDADNYNRVLSDATHWYRYDDEGNQTARMLKEDGTREAFSWDHRNRLTSIKTQLPREVAHWRFDGNALDSTANNLDGTLQGDAAFNANGTNLAAYSGGSLETFGTADYVSMGNEDLLKLRTHDLSVALWFNPDADAAVKLMGQGNPNNAGGIGYDIIYRGDLTTKRIDFRVNDGVTVGQYDRQVLSYDTGSLVGGWHHVAVTIDRDGDVVLYIDGVERDRDEFDQNLATNDDIIGTSAFVSGGYSSGIQSLDGRIDDLRVWHEPLDEDDIAAIYASTDPLYESNTAAYVENTKIVEYTYDAFDRRVLKEIDDDGDGDVDEAHQYIYDGEDIVLAFDKDAELTNRYLHGPAVDQILADEQYGAVDHDDPTEEEGITYWPLTDNLGSVRQLVGNDGEEAKRIEYDSFGQMTVVSGGAVDHIFGYTGREHDAESHLQFNRARYYDAALGRWLSEDPIGFAAGDANFSRYVGNGPTNSTDPSGLQEQGGQILPKPRTIITADGAIHPIDAGKIDQSIVDRIENGNITVWKGSQIVGFGDRDGNLIAPEEKPLRVTPEERDREQELQDGAQRTKEINDEVAGWLSFLADFLPVVGSGKGATDAVIGQDTIAGYELSASDRCIAAAGVAPGGKWIGKGLRGGWRWLKGILGGGARHGDKAADVAGDLAKQADAGTPHKNAAGDAAKAGKKTLRQRMGTPPASMTNPQAHHDLPQADRFKPHWNREGLDIDDPAHGRWVEGTPPGKHQNWSKKFNDEWDEFFDKNPKATREQILDKMNELRVDPRFQ
jgi:RHS repeat-associated protein